MAEPQESCGDYCLIFNNENFTSRLLPRRPGSEKDATDLQQVFLERNFQVDLHKDKTVKEITNYLSNLHKQGKYGALFVFFLSHGYYGHIFGKKGSTLSIAKILDLLSDQNCPSFAGKAKVLIFQSCRLFRSDPTPVQVKNDFYLAYATQPNCETYRDSKDGSFYIQCLVEVIREYGETKDWAGITTAVNERMKRHNVPYPPDNQCGLSQPFYLRKERNSQMVLSRYSSLSSFGEEMVPPSSSLKDLTKPTVGSYDYQTWPKLRQKHLKNKQHQERDPSATDIARPYETSINIEVPIKETEQPLITTKPVKRVCLIITNHSLVINAPVLHEMLTQYQYSIIEVSNISVDTLMCLMKGTNMCNLESFLLIYICQGKSCKCYDNFNNEIQIDKVVDQLSGHIHINRAFFFETILISSFPPSFSDSTQCLSAITGSLSAYLSSLHSCTLPNQNRERQLLQHMCIGGLPHSTPHWCHIVRQCSIDQEISYHTTESMIGEEEFFKLQFITHIFTQLGQHLIKHKTDINTVVTSSLQPLFTLAFSTLQITSAILEETIIMNNSPTLLLHNAINLEKQLVALAKQLLLNIDQYSHGKLKIFLQKCEKKFVSDFHSTITKCLTSKDASRKEIQFCYKQVQNWEKKSLKSIGKIEKHFAPYSKVLEDEERLLDNVIIEDRNEEQQIGTIGANINQETNMQAIEEVKDNIEVRPNQLLQHEINLEGNNQNTHTVQHMQNASNDYETASQSATHSTSNHGNTPPHASNDDNTSQPASNHNNVSPSHPPTSNYDNMPANNHGDNENDEWSLLSYHIEDNLFNDGEWEIISYTIDDIINYEWEIISSYNIDDIIAREWVVIPYINISSEPIPVMT